jgi:hypothetical protein
LPVQAMAWNWNTAEGGDDGFTGSIQVNFAPSSAVAQVSISQCTPGLGAIGISQFVTRATPAGPDQEHDNSMLFWPDGAVAAWYPPVAHDPLMTGVTATFNVGGNEQQITGTVMVFLWS